jgi:hypothetical protein
MSRGPRRDSVRCQRMCELYRGGMTLQQIGTAYGITRERVRQIVKREGVSSREGGVGKRAADKLKARQARSVRIANARTRVTYGCDAATVVALNGGKCVSHKGAPAHIYLHQRKNAIARGIEWAITFPEWKRLWDESGKWDQRGRRKNAYVMARKQDFGPYAPWNVYITTMGQNAADYQAELKRRGVRCADGYKRLPERIAAMEAA